MGWEIPCKPSVWKINAYTKKNNEFEYLSGNYSNKIFDKLGFSVEKTLVYRWNVLQQTVLSPLLPYRPVTPAAHGWHLYVFLNLFYIAASLLTRRGGCTWRTPGSTSRHKSGSRSYSRTLEKETRAPIEAWECYYQVLFKNIMRETPTNRRTWELNQKSPSHF